MNLSYSLLPLLLYYALYREVSMCSSHLRQLCSPSLRTGYLLELFGILLPRRCVCSPFVDLYNPLFMSVWTHGYFILWFVFSTTLLLKLKEKFLKLQVLGSGSSFCGLLCSFDDSPSMWHWLVCFGHVLTFWHYKVLQAYLVYILSQFWDISPMSPGSCYWRMVLETKIRVPSVLIVRDT